MNGLHATEIDCLLSRALDYSSPNLNMSQHRPDTHVRWLGVFARDKLPEMKHECRPFALVLNTDPGSKPGQHWLAIFGPLNGPIELFDSFGLAPSSYGLASLYPTHSRIQLQSPFSALCGHYCIYFIYKRSKSLSAIELNSFHGIVDSLKKIQVRDDHVKSFVNDLKLAYRILNPSNRTGQCSKLKCSFC